MSFTADISKLSKKWDKSLYDTAVAVKIELFSSVILSTRWDTGRLRGNWQTSVGVPKISNVERLDKTGIKAIAEVEKTVKGNTVDYLTNNLPYAVIYEEKDAMIAKNVRRIRRIIKKAIKDVRKN